jgi:hypothetical protein
MNSYPDICHTAGFHAALGLPDGGLLAISADSCLISGNKAQNYKIKKPLNTYKMYL